MFSRILGFWPHIAKQQFKTAWFVGHDGAALGEMSTFVHSLLCMFEVLGAT